MEKGKLIVMEGLDGSGKATQTRILCSEIRKYNKSICKVSFPSFLLSYLLFFTYIHTADSEGHRSMFHFCEAC